MAENEEYLDDEGGDEYEQAYEQHRLGIYDLLAAYADEHDLSDSFLAQLVADIGISMRMVAYASETEKPSVGGLRLDLDRFAREFGETLREAKKDAAGFIADARAALEEEDAKAEADEVVDAKTDTSREH